MPIDKVTAAQFRDALVAGITSRNSTHDTAYGPIRDAVIDPVAGVLEQQNDRARKISLLLSLVNGTEFSESDLNAFVFNEGLLRVLGDYASVELEFSTGLVPSSDQTVQRGYPLASLPDESTGQSITFVATEEKTLPTASAAAYAVPQSDGTTRYVLTVPAVAVVAGTAGRVGANRITRTLRPLVGFDKVTNPSAAVGGLDAETNDELITRYLLAVTGRQMGSRPAIERFILDNFGGVSDVNVIYGTNALLTRAATDARAVDALVIGEQALSVSENLTFLGLGQVLAVTNPPLIDVASVTRGAPAATYTEGTDYEVVFDATGVSGSNRAVEGVRFLASSPAPPDPGNLITVVYRYNNLVRQIQAKVEERENEVIGQDLLVRLGTQVAVLLAATLTVAAGQNATSVKALARTALIDYFATLGMGDDVEASDLQLVVRRISGVDNFVITNLNRSGTAGNSATDLAINDNEYARLDASNLSIP